LVTRFWRGRADAPREGGHVLIVWRRHLGALLYGTRREQLKRA